MQGIRNHSLGLPTRACAAGVLCKAGEIGDFPMVLEAKKPFINVLGKVKRFYSVSSPLP